jgi:hypothetical protein
VLGTFRNPPKTAVPQLTRPQSVLVFIVAENLLEISFGTPP